MNTLRRCLLVVVLALLAGIVIPSRPVAAQGKGRLLSTSCAGHGFVGVHSATDTFYMWPQYLELIGGYFNNHPWHQNVTVDVVDPSNPIVSGWGSSSFQINALAVFWAGRSVEFLNCGEFHDRRHCPSRSVCKAVSSQH
jgi:Trehalose utilisation